MSSREASKQYSCKNTAGKKTEGNNVLCPCKTASHWFYYQQDSCFTKGFCQVHSKTDVAPQLFVHDIFRNDHGDHFGISLQGATGTFIWKIDGLLLCDGRDLE